MKKLMFAALAAMLFAPAFVSCAEEKKEDKVADAVQAVKDAANDAADKAKDAADAAADKAKEAADKVKEATK